MTIEKSFPLIIAALFLGASVVYIAKGDVGRAMYFFASFMTSTSVAFIIK